MLGYRPSKEASSKARSLEELVDSFQNRSLNYWVEDGHYQLILYGDLAFIRDFKGDRLWANIPSSESQAILDQFKALPGLQEFKNTKANEVKSRATHRVVFINDEPGIYPDLGQFSYSIPKDEKRDAYREWFHLIEAAIQKFRSEQAGRGDGDKPSN